MRTENVVRVWHVINLFSRPRFVKTVASILTIWLLCYFVFFNETSLWMSGYLSMTRHVAYSVDPKSINSSRIAGTGHLNVSSFGVANKTSTYLQNSLKTDQQNSTNIDGATETCQFPVIDAFDPSIIALSTFNKPINCEKGVPHLVYMSGYTIKVNQSRTALYANKTYPFKECQYKSITKVPGSDYTTVVLYTSRSFEDKITPRDEDDNLIVECVDTNNTAISRSYFTLIRVKYDLELELESKYKKHVALNSPKEVLNVLMIGIDGNSKQNLERHMPKTRNFLLNELNALELHKYNKVGENTFPNMCSLLTGKSENEIQRDHWTIRDHFDFVNGDFLWSDFSKVGYRTGAFLDDNYITAFHYLKKGWDKPPVDYYMRATILKRNRDPLMKFSHCVGDIPEITSNHNFWIQMASTFNNSKTKPYFGFSFSTHLTHDNHNLASAGDHLYLQFFQELRDKNLINNTVIIFFSDHGQRFGRTRTTYNGMLESRMPYMFLVFPPWFNQKYPELIKVLKINQDRLTANADVHATLQDLVNFQATTGKGDLNKRGISLFYEIPRERTCQHAGIPMEFCVCQQMTAENISTSMVRLLAEVIERKLELLTRPYRSKCAQLRYKSTKSLMKIKMNTDQKMKDDPDITWYQLTIITNPGDAIYESTLKFHNSTKKPELVGDIMRLNIYRGQAECINNPKLRQFCFCKK